MNRYKINSVGKYEFYTFSLGQNFNKDIWLENKGNFALDEDGKEFEFYLTTPDGEGNYQEDTAKSSQDVKDKRIIEIDVLLDAIDLKKVRPLSAIAVEINQADVNYLNGLNTQSGTLKEERETLI